MLRGTELLPYKLCLPIFRMCNCAVFTLSIINHRIVKYNQRGFYLSTKRGREICLFSNGLGMGHANRRRVVALETLPSNLPNVQWCCVYFVGNQSSSCEVIISQLRKRTTCQQFLHAFSWYIVVLAVRSNCLLSQQSVEDQLDAFKVTFVWCNSYWGLAKGSLL